MRKKSKQKNFENLMTPILSKLCKAQRNTWNYIGSQSFKAETWNTAEFFIPVNSMQNDVVWGGFRRRCSRPCCNIFLILSNFLVNRILIGCTLSSWPQLFWHFKLFALEFVFSLFRKYQVITDGTYWLLDCKSNNKTVAIVFGDDYYVRFI